jgi:O-methyltransferase
LLSSFWSRRRPSKTDLPQPAPSLRDKFPEARDWELNLIRAAQPITMTSSERLWALLQAVSYLEANDIGGDFVECGVWKGGSSFLMAGTLVHLGSASRRIFLFDTFGGMPPPTDKDGDNAGRSAQKILKSEAGEKNSSLVWAVAGKSEVQQNMLRSGYPSDKVMLIQGDVRDTLETQAPRRVALARLDTDWYESTKHELDVLMPRMAPGGVVIIDDYGHWSGSRTAVDEWLAGCGFSPLISRIDYTGRLWIMP